MKTIIIGAGRGRRLDYLTKTQPKPFTKVKDKRILDWILEAHKQPEIKKIYYIGGYLIDTVKKNYPNLIFRHNNNWEHNNILQSLFYAKNDFRGGFICSYADILYTKDIVNKILESRADICLGIDTNWRHRYQHRSKHPTSDAEKVTAQGTKITAVNRAIPDDLAAGEFIGVAKFSARAAKLFKKYYERLSDNFCFENNIPLNRAYLIHFLDYLLKQGLEMGYATTHGQYIEVDTLEDYDYAQNNWLN